MDSERANETAAQRWAEAHKTQRLQPALLLCNPTAPHWQEKQRARVSAPPGFSATLLGRQTTRCSKLCRQTEQHHRRPVQLSQLPSVRRPPAPRWTIRSHTASAHRVAAWSPLQTRFGPEASCARVPGAARPRENDFLFSRGAPRLFPEVLLTNLSKSS